MTIVRARQRRYRTQQAILSNLVKRRKLILKLFFMLYMSLLRANHQNRILHAPPRQRRLERNTGWWDIVWNTYSPYRFKKTFRVSRETFEYLLNRIRPSLERQSITEDAISPEFRLAVCLYRLGRGDYYYTISELTGLGTSTVCEIVIEVSQALVEHFWEDEVASHFPQNTDELKRKMEEMDKEWQFTYAFAAIDGCHISIKCPAGGSESAKEYHNFKNFYSIVMMAMVDAKYRIIWASAGFAGNAHDSIIFQATDIYAEIARGHKLPSIAQSEGNVDIPPLILGDSAFPFHTWLMKLYGNAILTPEQRYFNYRLSRARMVTEGAYGKLKGRWRVLSRKCESKVETVKAITLACVVLHNVCIAKRDVTLRQWDMRYDPVTNKRRSTEEVQRLLQMRSCQRIRDTNRKAVMIREALKNKFYREKQIQTLH